MTGLLGGLLGAVNSLGGLVLSLLIGGKGFSPNPSARNVRVLIGAYLAGVALGFPVALSGLIPTSTPQAFWLVTLAIVPVVSLLFFFALEWLRTSIEASDDNKPRTP